MTDPRRYDGTGMSIGHVGDRPKQLEEGYVDIPVSLAGALEISGTWTLGVDGNDVPELVRTAADTDEILLLPVPLMARWWENAIGTAASLGLKPIQFTALYEVETAILDDVLFQIEKLAVPAHGSGVAAATVLAGDDDDDYDADHDTAAERNAVDDHTAVVTIPEAEQEFLGKDEWLQIRVAVDGSATGQLNVKGGVLRCALVPTDI
jgi:hypothetical protein